MIAAELICLLSLCAKCFKITRLKSSVQVQGKSVHRGKLRQFMLHEGLESELEEISWKINFWQKGTVSGKLLKALWALNEHPTRNCIKKMKNSWFQKYNISSRGPPLCSEICNFIWMCRYTGAMKWYGEMCISTFRSLGTDSYLINFCTFALLKSFTS